MNTKVDSLRRTLAVVLAKELSPHLKPANAFLAPTPTIVPVLRTTVSTSVTTVAATTSTQTTARPTPLNTTTTSSEAYLPTTPNVTVSTSPNLISTPISTDEPTSAQFASPQPLSVINETDIPIGRDMSIDTSGQQLISLPELTKIFNRSCSRRNMAANLIRALVDEETRKLSNVSGRGKDMLDPVVVNYVKKMSFQFFPLNGSEKETDEWSKCIVSIDESSRRLKNKPRKQKP